MFKQNKYLVQWSMKYIENIMIKNVFIFIFNAAIINLIILGRQYDINTYFLRTTNITL